MSALGNQKYIKVSAIYKKIRLAEEVEVPIYISGAVAYGKTAAVEYYYRKQAHFVLSGEAGYLTEMPKIEDIRQRVIVIDDISWITDDESRKYVVDLVKQRKQADKQIVLIGRSPIPAWLRVAAVEEDFVIAGEKDLMFTEHEIKIFLENYDITASKDELARIREDTYGHPLTLMYMVYHLKNRIPDSINCTEQEPEGCGYDTSVVQQIQLDLFHYYDKALYEKWDIQMRELLLAVCQYPTFTVPMMEMITSYNNVPQLIEKAMAVGTFLTKLDEETYSYRIHLQKYLQWKQSVTYTPEMIRENYCRAAHYYEMTGQIELALKYYTRGGNEERIVELLIMNARKHPGTAHFFETREYYFSLPEETILKSPVLISGMSMLYALILQPERSNYWYEKLVEYEKNAEHGSQERKEATVRIAYLNIALPQKGIHGIIKMLKTTATLCMNKKIQLPELSVTSNLPSIMNGGLDFCEWSRSDKELAVFMKKPIEIVLGKYGVGLVNIALAESGLEKGTMDSYEIMTRLNSGYHMSDVGGKIEMCFAATGLMIKEHMLQGQPVQAESIYNTFYDKVISEKATQLLPNMQTLHMWMRLVQGDTKEAENWLAKAPNDMIAFCILDRYHQINKIRALIALDRKEEALALIERMNLYFTRYERHYLWMENQILKSILLYRMGNAGWQETFNKVLEKASRYNFIPIFALEGIALKPLLEHMKTPGVSENGKKVCKESYLEDIKLATDKIAVYYPNYMKVQSSLTEPLTDSEKRILKLMCSGISSKEICDLCYISYSGFRFHARNIYRKMNVSNRAEAEREAVRLGIDR